MSIPSQHGGTYYVDTLARLARATHTQRYLEIGISKGFVLSSIPCTHAIGIDPDFQLTENIAAHKNRVSLYQTTSDAFFEAVDPRQILSGPIDFAFLDGMHVFEFLLRDFFNTESACQKDSVIAMHDCLPLAASMAHRDMDEAHKLTAGTPFFGWWTGDVWKVISILRKYRPDLTLTLTDDHPTGLVFVTGLNPASRVLQERYEEIVATFSAVPNDDAAIAEMYSSGAITSAEEAIAALSARDFR